MSTLEKVKDALGITGDYHDKTLTEYIEEVNDFLVDAGVPRNRITSGVVAKGVSDLWNYGEGKGKLSQYFIMRASQLSLKGSGA